MSQSPTAGALGAKTARACDGCVRRRARWYCAADDAFLCQACDASVHSANPVARRHHRVRLKSSSSSSSRSLSSPAPHPTLAAEDPQPPWLHGFRRKARTPRGKPAAPPSDPPLAAAKVEPLVPELEDESQLQLHDDEHLLYRVPIFDPALAGFCPRPSRDEEAKRAAAVQLPEPEAEPDLAASAVAEADDAGFAGFHPSAVDLAEFAANMESLLGQGLDDEGKFCIDALGLTGVAMEADGVDGSDKGRVKPEFDFDTGGGGGGGAEGCDMDVEMDLSRETLELNFDCASPPEVGDEADEEHKAAEAAAGGKRKMILRLDYEAVIAEWSCKGCLPWTDGERPQFDPGDWWPDFTGMWGGEAQGFYGGEAAATAAMGTAGDGGREARVTRYREKRRTRLFSKKIRYEVRKLNAEKRPRMKGRFVKRATVYPAAVPPPGPFRF